MESETGYTNGASQMDLLLIRGGCALVSEQKTVSHIHVYHIFFSFNKKFVYTTKKAFIHVWISLTYLRIFEFFLTSDSYLTYHR